MKTFLVALLIVALLGVLGVLAAGIVGLARGVDGRQSNKLMRARVILQGAAILLFALVLLALKS